MTKEVSTIEHYEILINDNNDPFRDSLELQSYMERWTGPDFIDLMELNQNKDVLEIGIGTGRMAIKVLKEGCKSLTGLDISPATLVRTKENLKDYINLKLLNSDIFDFESDLKFDVIYSVLTFMHIEHKEEVIKKIVSLLKENGIFMVSLDANPEEIVDFGNRLVKVYPSDVKLLVSILKKYGCQVEVVQELFDDYEPEKKVATVIKALYN
jgi:ubiquinone/menaquinone biosynthesis C-methylase UbiE